MRILITSIVDLKRTAHNRLHEFVANLSRRHQVTVLASRNWWKEGQTDATIYLKGMEDMLRGIELRYVTEQRRAPLIQELLAFFDAGKVLKEINGQEFDVHFNYNSLFLGYAVARRLRAGGIATVFDLADDLGAMAAIAPQVPSPLRPLGAWLGWQVIKRNIALAKIVTFTCSALSQAYGLPQAKSILIPNGVDTTLFRGLPPQKERERLGIDGGFVIGHAGVLREWVDLEPVFAAVAGLKEACPDIKVLLVGEEGGLKRNRELASRYAISERVFFTGTVPYTEVPKYISCMDLCLVPHKPNGVSENALPLKLFEYMTCEKPVISSPASGVREAVGPLVIYCSTKEEHEQQIMRLYRDRELGQRLGREGRRFVEENYSWSVAAARLESVLEEVRRRTQNAGIPA